MAKQKKLTHLQQSFVTLIDLNERGGGSLTDAEILKLAGSKSTGSALRVAASKLLHLGNIQKALTRARIRRARNIQMSPDEIIHAIENIAKFVITDLCTWDETGKLTYKASAGMSKAQLHAIKSVNYNELSYTNKKGKPGKRTTTKFEVYDKMRALDSLARIKQMLQGSKQEETMLSLAQALLQANSPKQLPKGPE